MSPLPPGRKASFFSTAQLREIRRLIDDALEADRKTQREYIRAEILAERAQGQAGGCMSLASARVAAQLGGQTPEAKT